MDLMKINRVSTDVNLINQQCNRPNDGKNHIGYAALGVVIAGTLFADPISPDTKFSCDLASIGYGAIGGVAGATIGGIIGEGRIHSIIAATVYGCLGVGIGVAFGPISIVGYKPYIVPVLGGVAGLVIAEIEPRIYRLANKILF